MTFLETRGVPATLSPHANAGLVFERLGLSIDPKSEDKERRREKFIDRLSSVEPFGSNPTESNAAVLAAALQRRMDLVKSRGGTIIRLRLISPLVCGIGIQSPLENGFYFHPTYGVPALPGSSVKGATRAYALAWSAEMPCFADAARIFGLGEVGRDDFDEIGGRDSPSFDERAGSVIFLDALPDPGTLRMGFDVMTPHYSAWYQSPAVAPGDWLSPTPLPFAVVEPGEPGAVFQFACLPRGADLGPYDAKTACDLLIEAAATIGFGAKTTAGYGRFEPVS